LITGLYTLYKISQAAKYINKIRQAQHTDLNNNHRIQEPKEHLFPQYFQNEKGLWIHHRDWILPNDVGINKPKGIIIISHGAAEHIQRYEHLAKFFRQNGYTVYGIDHQGHGMSDGDSGHVENFEDFVNDLLLFSQRIADEYPNSKRFLLGHSLGGLISLYCAMKNPNLFNGGLILSSPYLGPGTKLPFDPDNSMIESIFRFLSFYFPKLPLIELDNQFLSHDPNILYHLQRDHLHFKGLLTARFGVSATDAARNMLYHQSHQIKFPYLLFGGSQDTLTDPKYWPIFHAKTSSKDKSLEIFDSLYHETMNENEPHQRKVFDLILKWIEQRSSSQNKLDIDDENEQV